jgi:hypothetical protein
MARVAVAGATGTIGRALVAALLERGDVVVALTRDPARATDLGTAMLVAWPEPKRSAPPPDALSGTDAVVNLLGEPIAQRWSEAAKAEIRDSRVLGTSSLVEAIGALPAQARPRAFVSQSATGYYGPRGDEILDERASAGSDFLAELVVEWEREATAAESVVRVAVTRTGVVLAPRSGALAQMLLPFRLGLGGPVAGGKQYVSWIHIDDVVGGLLRCIDTEALRGPVNLTAPTPVTNREFGQALGRGLRRPAVLPVPKLGLKLAYGEMSSVVTTGQRVVPERLIESGYEFRYPELDAALRDVLARW